jgi:hypothetical protein
VRWVEVVNRRAADIDFTNSGLAGLISAGLERQGGSVFATAVSSLAPGAMQPTRP